MGKAMAVVVALALCGWAGAVAIPPARPVMPRVATPRAGEWYHGVYPGGRSGEEDDITLADVTSYEETVGKRVAWVYFSHNWYASPRFPRETVEWIRASGSVPYIRLMLRGEDNTQGEYPVEKIISGECDALLRAWAEEAREFGGPLIVEYGTECNGEWFPWNGKYHGAGVTTRFGDPTRPDGPERFVAAYRRIVEVMRAAGAWNILWVFHVNATDWPEVSWNRFENYYPGDRYVDWVAVSAYGPQDPLSEDCVSFREQMDACYARLTALAPGKPVVVAEFGCSAGNPLMAPEDWARPALEDLLGGRWPRVVGFSWWNERWQNDSDPAHDSNMRVQDCPALAAVFREMLEAAGERLLERPRVEVPREVTRPRVVRPPAATAGPRGNR